MVLPFVIDEKKVIPLQFRPNVEIFSQLNIACRAQNKSPPVAPSPQSPWIQPIQSDVVGGAIVPNEVCSAVLIPLNDILVVPPPAALLPTGTPSNVA